MNKHTAPSDENDDLPVTARRFPSILTLLHIFWLKKWPILILWLLFAIPAGVSLSIFDLPTSYSAATTMRFPSVVGAQTNVMRDVAITERESIEGIIKSWQVLNGTIKKLGMRMNITTPEVFRKNVFRSLTYVEELGQGKYILEIEKGGGRAVLDYMPKEAPGKYNLYNGPIGADHKISVNGLELVLQDELLKLDEGFRIEMTFKSLEEAVSEFRDAMVIHSLGSSNLELKVKNRDPYFVADIVNTLRIQFLEVYYGTTEVQDVGILVQMERDLDQSKKKLDQSQTEVSNFYAEHPELMRTQGVENQQSDNLTFLESRQEMDRLDRSLKQIRSVAAAKPEAGSEDEKFFWASEMIQAMVAAEEPRAVILRGTMSRLANKQAQYKANLGPEHPKMKELELEVDTLNQQIDVVTASLTKRLEKDLSDARVQATKSAPKATAQIPIKVTLELERLNQVNIQNQQIYDRLLESYNRAKLTTGSEFFKVTVVDPARPAIYKRPTLQTRLIIAALAVLVLSLAVPALFLMWNVLLLKVWTKDDVESLLRMKLLGTIALNPQTEGAASGKPSSGARRKRRGRDEDDEDEPQGRPDPTAPTPSRPPDPLLLFYGSAYRIQDLEAFRIIREETENYFRNKHPGKCCIMVTSTQPNEGKTTVISNLAMTFARKGKRTLLVDADFRLGRIDKMFNMPGGTGLDELLSQTDLSDAEFIETVTLCFQPTMQRNLVIVPRQKSNPNAGELVSSDRFKQFILMAREQFDVVLIDTPPVMITPEPLSLAEVTDGVIYVCRSGSTSVGDSLEAVKILQERGIRVAAVLNGVKRSPFAQNRYSRYAYYYQSQPKPAEPSA